MTDNSEKITRSTLVNIDSACRDIYPKNIYKSNGQVLPKDPLQFIQDSNIINVNYPNHNFTTNDLIIIQNVLGLTKTLTGTFYLLNKFGYLIVIFKENQLNINYKKYINALYVNIELYGQQDIPNMINNMPINSILGMKQLLTYADLPGLALTTDLNAIFSVALPNYTTDILNNNTFFIELPFPYTNANSEFIQINQFFKISYLHIAGIPLSYINANYPINNDNNQSNQEVYNVIDNNTFQIKCKINSNLTIKGGGANIQMMKIINTINGYPNANSYSINLKKSFNNVVRLELVSTEFPYTDLSIRKGINDKLYWRNINDGLVIYSIQVDEGYYTTSTLLTKLTTLLNQTLRIISTPTKPVYNFFNIVFESNTQTITFTNYVQANLPNSLSLKQQLIDNKNYYILTIIDPNNIVDVGDLIVISNVTTVTYTLNNNGVITIYSIASTYINGTQTVINVDLNSKSYDVNIGLVTTVVASIVGAQSSGGTDVLIQSKTKVSLLFNKPDTLGDIIGFKNPGDTYSVTPFAPVITNKDPYINSFNYDYVGNTIPYLSPFVNLTGKYNYFLMYLNDIEYIYTNNTLPLAFAKILLSGNPGDVLFDTYIKQPYDIYSKDFPISTLTDFTIKFLYADGTPLDFRNVNHSFTLRVVEEITKNDKTYINSNMTTFAKQMLELKE